MNLALDGSCQLCCTSVLTSLLSPVDSAAALCAARHMQLEDIANHCKAQHSPVWAGNAQKHEVRLPGAEVHLLPLVLAEVSVQSEMLTEYRLVVAPNAFQTARRNALCLSFANGTRPVPVSCRKIYKHASALTYGQVRLCELSCSVRWC